MLTFKVFWGATPSQHTVIIFGTFGRLTEIIDYAKFHND
jgi:hypothetical protein